MHARVFEALADTSYFVGREIVDDDDAARPHFRDQAFREPLLEDCAGHRTWEQLWSQDGVMGQPGDEGRCHPVTMRHFGEEFLALLTPAMAARHRRVRAGLIDKYQRGEVEIGLRRPPELAGEGDIGPILFSREERFF
jgi:hypothetical protein